MNKLQENTRSFGSELGTSSGVKIVPCKDNLCSRHAEKMISIKINNKCNRSCSFCVDRGGRNGGRTDVGKIAKEAIGLTEYRTVIITGGEPFLCFDDVVELAGELRHSKNRIVLNTNGTLLTRDKVKRLNGIIDELQISIHHYNEKKHGEILGGMVSFDKIKDALADSSFVVSVNSTFNKWYRAEERQYAVDKMVVLAKYLGAERLRLTELKKVEGNDFVLAKHFFQEGHEVTLRQQHELIAKGCTTYFEQCGISISVKRLCGYAKGVNATAFSCCFIDTAGQEKIDIDTEDTFKVIYSDGSVVNDWEFDTVQRDK